MSRKVRAVLLALPLTMAATTAYADALDGAYRGSIVCEKHKWTNVIMRAPADMTVTGTTVVFAHPLFNRQGTFTVGSEIATGTIASDGSIKLTSNWKGGMGYSFAGTYSGTLTSQGGVLTGTQAWVSPDGPSQRLCSIALVQSRS